jgi:phosphoserine phosphatase
MNALRIAFTSACLLTLAVAPLPAAEVQLTGELVDQACYLKDKKANVGVSHQDCATRCAMKGDQVALVTDGGEVIAVTGELTADHNALLALHMSHRVVLTGEVIEKDGKKAIAATMLKMAPPRM